MIKRLKTNNIIDYFYDTFYLQAHPDFLVVILFIFLNGTYNIISVGLSPQDTYLVDIATDIPTFTDAFDVVFHACR